MILMWNDRERDYIYMWCPNERWMDLSLHNPSQWTWGEVVREWDRATRNLLPYRDFIHIKLCSMRTPCGLMERIRMLEIDRISEA